MLETSILRRAPTIETAANVGTEFSVTLKPAMARFVLRGDATVAKLAGKALGLTMPTKALASSTAGATITFWLGPDEWLILAQLPEANDAQAALTKALAKAAHSLVDVSHRQVAFGVSGRLAARVLSSGCPLDLGLKAFPVGMVTRTLFHKAEVILWREPSNFHMEVWRSFAPYVSGHLAEAFRSAEGLPDAALP